MMEWGRVDWHHSVEETDLKSRLAAAVVIKELTSTHELTPHDRY